VRGRVAPVTVVVVAVVVLAGCAGLPLPADTPALDREVTVIEVVDGDTIDVRMPDGSEETVRLLGVDSPETYAENDPAEFEGVPDTRAGRACLRAAGENATAFVAATIERGTVRVRTDPAADRRGSYGRLLAYVTVGNESLNRALLDRGHARLYDTEFSRRDDFAAAEERAQAAGRGLWACR
jgi:micrococcal nuclease